jgi:hypothetical protein
MKNEVRASSSDILLEEIQNTFKEINTDRKRANKINWGQLCVDALNESKKPMTSAEILGHLFQDLTEEHRIDLSPRLSSSLFKLCKQGRIIKYDKPGTKNYYYGLSSWFEESLPFEKIILKKEFIE